MVGGDNAPLAVLEGAAAAVQEYGVQLIGVGDEALVRKTAADNNIPLDGIELVNCTETIEMCDEPARAIRSKKMAEQHAAREALKLLGVIKEK